VTLNVFMLGVVMPNVVMLKVVAPSLSPKCKRALEGFDGKGGRNCHSLATSAQLHISH
jgi:hypothetical protein